MKYYSATFVLFFLISCDSSPVEIQGVIDPSIVGIWYTETTDSSKQGPKRFIEGIEITEEGIVNSLAIHTETGKLYHILDELGDRISYYKLDGANHNKLLFTFHNTQQAFSPTSGKSTYRVEQDKLYFNINNNESEYIGLRNVYTRTELGENLASPILSKFKIELTDRYFENYRLENLNVSPAPNAYAYFEQDKLYIHANLNYYLFMVDISVNDFHGVGNYDKNAVLIRHEELHDDLLYIFTTENERCDLVLEIDSYIADKYISGTVSFTYPDSLFHDYFEEKKLTNGIFKLPIYE